MKVHLEKEFPCASPIVSLLLASSVSRPTAVSRQALASRLQLLPSGKMNNIGGVKALKGDIDFLAEEGVLTKIGGHSVALSERAWQSAVRLMMEEGGGNARTDLKERVHRAGVNGLDCLAGNSRFLDWIKNRFKSKSQKNADVEGWVQYLESKIEEKQGGEKDFWSHPNKNKIVQPLVNAFPGLWYISPNSSKNFHFKISFNDNGTVQTLDYQAKKGLLNWTALFQKLMTKFNRTAEQVAKGFFSQGMLEQSIQSALEGFFQDRLLTEYFNFNLADENFQDSEDIHKKVLSYQKTDQKKVSPKDAEWYIVKRERQPSSKENPPETEKYDIHMHYNSNHKIQEPSLTNYDYQIHNGDFWSIVFQDILIFKIENLQRQQSRNTEQSWNADTILEEIQKVRNEFAWHVDPCLKMQFQQDQVGTGLVKPFIQARNKQIETIVKPKFEGMTFEDWGKPEAKLTEYLSFTDSGAPVLEPNEELQQSAKHCLNKCDVNNLWYMEKELTKNKKEKTGSTRTVDVATIRVVRRASKNAPVFKYIKLQENKENQNSAETHYYLMFYLHGYAYSEESKYAVDKAIGPIHNGQHNIGTPFTQFVSETTGILWQKLDGSGIVTMLDKMFQLLKHELPQVVPANFFVIRPNEE